ETLLKTLMYSAGAGASPRIDITVTDSSARSGSATISVESAGAATFEWTGASGTDDDFSTPANWSTGATPPTTPPGGASTALFAAGNHVVAANGAVGQILNFGATTLTGTVVAQGIDDISAVVDAGGALTLTGGALLSAQQQVVV